MKLNLNFLLSVFLLCPVLCIAQGSIEDKKNAAIKELTLGCSTSLIAPSFEGFMERAKAAGKTFPDENSARKAYEQKNSEMQKSDFYKNQLLPAATTTCQCMLESTNAKIKDAKTQTEIEKIIKNLKPDPNVSKQCAEKYLIPTLKNMKQ